MTLRTKQEADVALATIALEKPVLVEDVVGDGLSGVRNTLRRRYTFGDGSSIEIDADPTPEQLADLARNLPVAEKDRADAAAKIGAVALADEVKPATEIAEKTR